MVEKNTQTPAPGEGGHAPSSTHGTSAAAEEAKVEAKRAAQVAAERAKGAVAHQKDMVADQVSGVANALRASVRELPEEQRGVARYAEQGAQRLEQLSARIRARDIDTLVSDAQDFARRNPLAFFAGSVAVGFFLSRFLKSSGERREAESTSETTLVTTETTVTTTSPGTTGPSL